MLNPEKISAGTTSRQWLQYLPLLVIAGLFIWCKLPHLNLPYYWDESWSYAPGVRLMYLHGPSLMPDAIDVFYSRGHPLFFYAAAAAWMRLFGASHLSTHVFALFVSVIVLVAVYHIVRCMVNWKAAIIATGVLALQVIFFVQASYVLPEVLVGLLSLLSLYLFTTRQYSWFTVALALLFFTKESGLVAGMVVGFAALYLVFQRKASLQQRFVPMVAVAFPVLLIGAFFLWQKQVLGWYFYPEHTGLMKWEWGDFYGKFRLCLEVLFFQGNRNYLFFCLLPFLLLHLYRQRSWYAPGLLFPALLVYVAVREKLPFINTKLLFAAIVLSLPAAAYGLRRASVFLEATTARFFVLGVWFLVAYVCFCALNFFTVRYLLAALVVLMVLYALLLASLAGPWAQYLLYAAMPVLLLIGINAMRHDEGAGDTSLGSFNAMRVQQAMVRFLEDRELYDVPIYGSSFQDREHLEKPYTGFLSGTRIFTHVTADLEENTRLAFFNNIEPDGRYDAIKADTAYQLLYRTVQGESWVEIYEKRP